MSDNFSPSISGSNTHNFKFEVEELPFWENSDAKLKFGAPIICSV